MSNFEKGLDEYETELREHGRARRGVIQPLETKVVETEGHTEEERTHKGIHWPIPQWETKFKRKHDPDKVYVRKPKNGGAPVPGIIMDPIHGMAIGCTEMIDIYHRGVEKEKELEKKSLSKRKGQLQDGYKAALKSAKTCSSVPVPYSAELTPPPSTSLIIFPFLSFPFS